MAFGVWRLARRVGESASPGFRAATSRASGGCVPPGLASWRSPLRVDCAALLGAGARARTHFALRTPFRQLARVSSRSALRAPPPPLRCSPPLNASPDGTQPPLAGRAQAVGTNTVHPFLKKELGTGGPSRPANARGQPPGWATCLTRTRVAGGHRWSSPSSMSASIGIVVLIPTSSWLFAWGRFRCFAVPGDTSSRVGRLPPLNTDCWPGSGRRPARNWPRHRPVWGGLLTLKSWIASTRGRSTPV